jgi:hypothetical protein
MSLESEKIRFSRLGENKTLLVVVLLIIVNIVPNFISLVTTRDSQTAIINGVSKTNNLLEVLIAQQNNIVDADAMKVIYKATLDQSRFAVIEACMSIIQQDQLGLESRQDFVRAKITSLMNGLYRSDVNELSLFYYKGRPLSSGLVEIDITIHASLIYSYLFLRYDNPDFRENLLSLVEQDFNNIYEQAVSEMMIGGKL